MDKLYRLAREAMEKSSNDRHKARLILCRVLQRDRALLAELLDPIFDNVSNHLITDTVRNINRSIVGRGGKPDHIRGISSIVNSPWYGYILPDGQKLSDARREQIEAAATMHGQNAKSNQHKADWLKALAAKMDAKRTVKQTFSEEQIAKLYEAARS